MPPLFGPVAGVLERHGDERRDVLVGERVDGALPLAAHGHEAAVAKEPELMGDGRLADAAEPRELPDRAVLGGEGAQDAEARVVGERVEDLGRGVDDVVIFEVGGPLALASGALGILAGRALRRRPCWRRASGPSPRHVRRPWHLPSNI